MDLRNKNLRDATVTSSSGVNVKETKQLEGEAKDSLSGKNVTEQYETAAGEKGKLGGQPDCC